MNDLDRYLNAKEVAQKLGIAVSSVWRWSKTGVLPPPVKLSEKTTRWVLSELENWTSQRPRLHNGE